jgi:hypothetical protein
MPAPHTSLLPAGRLTVALSVLVGLLVLGITGFLRGSPSPPDPGTFSAVAQSGADLADLEERRTDPTIVTVATSPPRSIATLPTVTPRRARARPTATAPRADYAAPTRPTLAPDRSQTSLPTVTPADSIAPSRRGCDPAYPEERTCIPPGPPLAQPCAITDERNFTVLPPDPRGLDRDRDGIGCEPIAP